MDEGQTEEDKRQSRKSKDEFSMGEREGTMIDINSRHARRRGLTLAELLVATTIMLMIATAVATLAATVHSTNSFCQGYTVSAQHARVALSRIQRTVEDATANEQFPGFIVVTEQAGGEELPSTLVVWNPTGPPANPTGLPLISEIVVYSPDPAHPNDLLEIRYPSDNTPVPPVTETGNWRSLTDQLRTSASTTKIVLTSRLRTAPLTGEYSDSLTPNDLRGTVRFRRVMAPSDQEWSQFQIGLKTWADWKNIDWPLDSYNRSYRRWTGMRAVVCQTELQIAPGSMASAAATAIPFYGSASITYQLTYEPPP
jgi:prepilin-type N-terminal cleavage/methylation domain-containing protein